MRNQFDGRLFRVTLKVWRKMNKLSAAEMAELAGVPPSTYNFIENGDKSPDLAYFSRLCQAMDVNAGDFFNTLENVKNG